MFRLQGRYVPTAFARSAVLVSLVLLVCLAVAGWIVVRQGAARYELGWAAEPVAGRWQVRSVRAGGPADGKLLAGDAIVSLNNDIRAVALDPAISLRYLPAEPYTVFVERGRTQLQIQLAPERSPSATTALSAAAVLIVGLIFLLVGALVGIAAANHSTARLAFLFCATAAAHMIGVALRPYRDSFDGASLWFFCVFWSVSYFPYALGYHVLSQFPRPVDESRPWRIFRFGVYAFCVALFLPDTYLTVVGARGYEAAVDFWWRNRAWLPQFVDTTHALEGAFELLCVIACGAVLVRNYRALRSEPDSVRRLKWLTIGIVVGLLPLSVYALALIAIGAAGRDYVFGTPSWIAFGRSVNIAVGIFPVALGYGVFAKEVFGVDIALRRSLQYLLAKRFLTLLLIMPAALAAARFLSDPNVAFRRVVLGESGAFYVCTTAIAGVGLTYRKAILDKLDDAFFRDVRASEQALVALIERLGASVSVAEMSRAVVSGVQSGLGVESVYVLARQSGADDVCWVSDADSVRQLHPGDSRARLESLTGRRTAIDMSGDLGQPELCRAWADAGVRLTVPIASPDGRVVGALLVGAKMSRQPFSKNDRALLQAVAAQFAVVRENLHLKDRVHDERKLRRDAVARTGAAPAFMRECPNCGQCFDGDAEDCTCGAHLVAAVPVERVLDGKYRLDQRIGRGSMGGVYEAVDLGLSRRVAVKLLVGSRFGDAAALRRFEREAQSLAKLVHPNIVTVFDYGVIRAEGAYLVMELLPGRNLRTEMNERDGLPRHLVVSWLDQLLAGLAAAHDRGIIHRDIKPENVFIGRPGGAPGVLKLLDFGLAKVRELQLEETLTMNGVALGTLGYMPLEQLLGDEVDQRADIFATGVIAFEMMTGVRPFAGATVRELADDMRRERSSWRGYIRNRQVERVLARCLSSDPGKRYHSATELRRALNAAWESQPEDWPRATGSTVGS